MIQNAYQGFAKQNYQMLDNLKLGYGGTKEEMKRLIADAAEMTDVQEKLGISVDASSLSFGNIVNAISVVQKKMGIAGTTQKEAEKTITGSMNAMKAAWGNLLPALIQGGDSFDQCVDNLVYSVGKFADNIKPAILKALGGVGDLIEELTPMITEQLPILVDELLPPLIKAAVSVVQSLIKSLPSIVSAIVKEIPNAAKMIWDAIVETFGDQLPFLHKITDFFAKNSGAISGFFDKATDAIVKFTPVLLGLFVAFKAVKGIKAITSVFGALGGGKGGAGGKKGGAGGKKGGLFGGLTSTFSTLAKTKPTVILKGLANLAIMLGGFMLLAAVFAKVAPYIAQLSDVKSLVKTIALVAVLGYVGLALAKCGEIAGKIKVSTVAKGLANMAIMIAGMSALLLLVTAMSLINYDVKKILVISALLGVLGAVGLALTIFGGIAGVIPVAVVALGLANMAIMIAGMSALLLLIHAVSFINFDFQKIIVISAILAVLGAVGTALTVFAGICGIIPTPVVLAGLANMALVLGGMSALIVAFGALTKINGFAEFIESGGKILVKICNIIGEMGGALIGGLASGVSDALPAIGENIGKFGENIKPLFNSIGGVDMAGVGAFFTSLVGLLGIATGNEIINSIRSFFGGEDESPLVKLGRDLTSFSTEAKGFFTTVAQMPKNGFANATKLFECLAGLKGLPKEGGVVGWFTGEINYTTLADGLNQLASEKIIGFFNTVSELKETGFDMATKLFECFAGLKKLPKEGGVVGWFAGEVNYQSIALGLGSLASDGVKRFFKMAGELKPVAFENTKLLFESLASIGDLPKEGGWWDKLTGGETTTLDNIATSLEGFSGKASGFFEQINNLKVGNINALWDSLKKSEEVTANVSNIIGEKIDEIVDKISELPVKMGDGLKNSGKSLSDALVSVWKDAVKASVSPVNKVLEAANWILKEFGSEKRVLTWTPYAKGTGGHKGGNALVNDGNGAELVQMPNGNAFIPQGRNVFIPNAPQGMKVLPADQTARLMGKKTPTFRYANGIGDIDIWSYIDNPKGLVSKATESVNYSGMSGFVLNVGKGMVSTFTGEMTAWVEKLFEEEGAKGLADYVASKGVEQWRSTVIRALKMEGQYNAANVKRTLYQMQTESGGNPLAINLWDSNAKKGIPSKGLMQVIDPTFKAYARAGFNKNIYDPLSNILASVRYAVSRYGTLAKAYRGVGYANGGIATKPSIFGEDGAEMAIPLSQSKRKRGIGLWAQTGKMLGLSSHSPDQDRGYYSSKTVENNTYSPSFNLTISGTRDERAMERKVKRWINEAMEDTFTGIANKNKVTREA